MPFFRDREQVTSALLLVSRRSGRAGISEVFHPNEAGVTLSQVSEPDGVKYMLYSPPGLIYCMPEVKSDQWSVKEFYSFIFSGGSG